MNTVGDRVVEQVEIDRIQIRFIDQKTDPQIWVKSWTIKN